MLRGFAGTPARAGYDYSRLYQVGRQETIAGYPRAAKARLIAAIGQQPREGKWVKIYGHVREPYLPHFYLGLAFFQLGQYGEALEEWEDSEQQGAVKLRAAEYKELLERRRQVLEEFLPQAAAGCEKSLEAVSTQLDEATKAVAILRVAGIPTDVLERRRGAIEAGSRVASARRLEGGAKRDFKEINSARDLAGSLLVDAATLLGEARGRLRSLDGEQLEHAAAGVAASPDSGGCRSDRRDALAALLVLLSARPELRGAVERSRLELALARTSMACGDLGAAAELLADARGAAAVEASEVARLEHDFAAERARLRADDLQDFELRDRSLTDFVEPAAAVDAGRCDREAIARLEGVRGAVRTRSDGLRFAAWIEDGAGIPFLPEFFLAKAHRNCGDVEAARASLLAAYRQGDLRARFKTEAGAIAAWVRDRQIKSLYSGSHALVLAASHYDRRPRAWNDLLGNNEKTINTLRDALQGVGFEVEPVVFDPTKKRFEQAVEGFIDRYGKGDSHDRLLIYFAGHGASLGTRYKTSVEKEGFLVPVDGAPLPGSATEGIDQQFRDSAIGMDQIDRWAQQIKAAQAVFVLDSCFSGAIFNVIAGSRGGGFADLEVELARLPLRLFITAGTDEQEVPDRSIFLEHLIGALSGREDVAELQFGLLSGAQLCVHLRNTVFEESHEAEQPQCGKMPSPFDKGDVIFALPRPLEETTPFGPLPGLPDEIALWESVRVAADRTQYGRYLDRYPAGRFAGLARHRLLAPEGP